MLRQIRRAIRVGNADALDPGSGSRIRQSEIGGRLLVRNGRSLEALCGPSFAALLFREAYRAFRRRESVHETGRAEPYGSAQDQQRARPDPSGPPNGENPDNRRDRRRAARRRNGHGLRPVRIGMHRIHGRARCGAPGAQRVPDEIAGSGCRSGHVRQGNAEGRDERCLEGLGHERARHVLLHRNGRRPASLSGDGSRLPIHHRQRGEAADARGRRSAAGHAHRGDRRRLQRDGLVLSFLGRCRCSNHRGGGRRKGRQFKNGALRVFDRRQTRRLAWKPDLSPPGRRRTNLGRFFDIRGPRLPRHRSGAFLAARDRPGRIRRDNGCRSARRIQDLLRA